MHIVVDLTFYFLSIFAVKLTLSHYPIQKQLKKEHFQGFNM